MTNNINLDIILILFIICVILYSLKVYFEINQEKTDIPHDPLIHKRENFDGIGKGFSMYYKPDNNCEKDVFKGSYMTSRAINDSHDCIISQKRMVSLK